MREKHTPKNRMDADLLYECDYGDFKAKIKVFGNTNALFCDWHLICRNDDILFLQSIAKFYAIWYSYWRDDEQERIKEKLFNY